MEINKQSDILGVITAEAIVEGRMVLLVGNQGADYNFGSRADLPGVKLPDDSTEAAKAKYVLMFAVDNRTIPIYESIPENTFALRRGWSVAENVPFSATVHLTPPGNKVGRTVPSGNPALGFGGGVFTAPSGAFIHSTDLETPGADLVVANTADDSEAEAGQLKYSATAGVAVVERYIATTGELQFRTLQP